jgi:hypothetical protein
MNMLSRGSRPGSKTALSSPLPRVQVAAGCALLWNVYVPPFACSRMLSVLGRKIRPELVCCSTLFFLEIGHISVFLTDVHVFLHCVSFFTMIRNSRIC